MILELFAGAGGWSEGLRMAGHGGLTVGIELDLPACQTAVAAGHIRICADVASYPVEPFIGQVSGLIASPPCPSFSMAGKGAGKLDMPLVYEHILAFTAGECPPEREWADERSALTSEPMRWAVALWPRWIALEQVPLVLPLWQYMAHLLRQHGYHAWCGILSAEEYAVPQTRKRAILTASLDGLVGPPVATHQAWRSGREPQTEDNLFGAPLPAARSMADTLGWGLPERPSWTVSGGGTDTGGAEIFGNAICRTRLAAISLRNETQDSEDVETMRVTVREAGILQSFPADYPWKGKKTAQYQQCGNAIPPLLAAAILRPLIEPGKG